MTVDELRDAVNAARQKMVDAHEKIERASAQNDEAVDMDSLHAEFDAAEKEWKGVQERFERACSLPSELKAPAVTSAKVEAGVAARAADVKVTGVEQVYRPDGGHSVFRDMYARAQGDHEASERLHRHMQIARQTRDLSTTDNGIGELVPPSYLVSDVAVHAKAGRPFADAVPNSPLLPGTDSISVPRILTGTSAAVQATENNAVSETDATSDNATSDVTTIAGQQDASVQLLEQSPIAVDQIIFSDLQREIARVLDQQMLDGSGSSNQLPGILNASGTYSVTYTTGTPTVAGLYPKVADAIQRIHAGRFASPTAVVMHPRRWAWFLSSLDSSNRPLVTPYAPQNSMGTLSNVAPDAVVGGLQGLPVIVDANIPITDGAGTNEDSILVTCLPDHRLWESPTRLKLADQTLAGQLTVKFVAYQFAAYIGHRYPKGTAVISGTGLAAPTF